MQIFAPSRLRHVAAAVLLLLVAVIPATPAAAGPVKCAEGDATADDRVFPEPSNSTTFLRFDEFQCAITYLDSLYPDLLEIQVLGESALGSPIYNVVMTDENQPPPEGRDDKERLLVVSSIHGGEVGGREGAVRNIEDMVDPRFLADEAWVQQVLDEFEIHWLFPNPDGWVAGDISGETGPGVAASRGNGNGTDLNRGFPISGWIGNCPLCEPEAQAIDSELLQQGDWFLGTDNHGQGPDTYAAAGLQIVGQFDYQKSETLARFADGITETMADYDVLGTLADLNASTGLDVGPYHWGTLYDMLGYSASGSLIDYYNTPDGVAGTGFATELTAGTEVNFLTFPPLLAQVWVDSIRAINYTMFQQAIDQQEFVYEVGGRTGYLFDPEIIAHDDENGAGYEPDTEAGEIVTTTPYAVTRMRFFEDLNGDADRPVIPVHMRDVLAGRVDLNTFDNFVITEDWMPEDGDQTAWLDALRTFAEAGGNLIVTDAAAPLLAELGLVGEGDVTMTPRYVGSVEAFTDDEHPLNANLRGVASQTYDTVSIGMSFGGFGGVGNTAPNWTVTQTAWEADGGFTAGTNGTGETVYGEKPLGEGRVRFLGALLPQPTEEYYHPFGLQNYAVTYTGYTLLQNMLEWTNAARVPLPIDRVFGPTRIETAIAFSAEAFSSSDNVVLARADKSPDALSASPFAAALDAPVLLTPSDDLDRGVRAELNRLSPSDVYLLGGESALSSEVSLDLREAGYRVHRLEGVNRYATAAAVGADVAARAGGVTGALLAAGEGDGDAPPGPDALSAGVLGAATGQPVLLTRPGSLPDETAAAITELGVETITIVGDDTAVSDDVVAAVEALGVTVERIEGEDRYATSVAVAEAAIAAGAGTNLIGLSAGDATADALAAGPALHHMGGTALLVDDTSLSTSQATADWLASRAEMLTRLIVAGGPVAIDDAVVADLRTLLTS